jgi:hypothetical protein
VNGAIHAATAKKAFVCGIDDGIHIQPGYVASTELHFRHAAPPAFCN